MKQSSRLHPLARRFLLGFVFLLPLLAVPSTVHGQPVDRAAEQRFTDGLELFQGGLYANALSAFDGLRQAFPNHPRSVDAVYYSAESHLALGREAEAIQILEWFDESYPQHPFAFGTRLSLGKYFFDQGQYDRAWGLLNGVLDRSPSESASAKALYWMAESRARQGQYDEAVDTFGRVVREFPETDTAPRAAYAIAFNQVKRGRYDEAAVSFENLAARFPNSEYARNIGLALAEVYYEIDDFSRAATEIENQLPYLSGDAVDRARFLLAESYNQLRRHDDAIVQYRTFTEGSADNPYYRRALFGLAWNYHYQESYQWAADNFRLVHESGADDLAAESMYYEAVNLRLSRQDRESVRVFENYTRNWPSHRLADHGWFELGTLQYQRRNWTEARNAFAVFQTQFEDSPIRGDALMNLGNTHIALGDFNAALSAFDEAIRLDAAPAELRERIIFQKAWLLYRNRDYARSSTEFLELFESNTAASGADEALFWAAESFFQLDRFPRAETLFERYLNTYPGAQHVEAATYALGWTYFRQGRYSEAIPQFTRFLQDYREESEAVPYRTDARLRLADSYFALKRYPEAVRVYGQLASDGDDYALYQIGQAYSNSGDSFEAISTFRQLLDDYPNSEWEQEARYQLAYLYFLGQEYELAIEGYRDLISAHPNDPLAAKAQYGIGDAYFNAGQTDNAVRAYRDVMVRYPSSPFTADAAAGIQFALMAAGQNARADAVIDSMATAMEGTPVAEELRYRQAEAKYQSGRTADARSDFQRFLQNYPTSRFTADAVYLTALIDRDAGRSADAMSGYERVLGLSGSARRGDAARELGHMYLDATRFGDALTAFRTMESAAGDDTRRIAEARYGQSRALTGLGRSDEALSILTDIVRDNPDSEAVYPAVLGLARLRLDAGDDEGAMPLLQRVAQGSRDETGAEALYLLGERQHDRGDSRGAIETLGRMTVLFAGYPDWMARSLYLQGQAFENIQEAGEALILYKEVVATYPDSPEATVSRARVEALENR